MEKEGFFVEIKEMVEDYVEDRLLLLKMQATEKAAKVSAVAFITLLVGFISLLLFMIISFIAGYYLSQLVNSYPGGFAILGAIYLLIILLLLYIHKRYTAKIISDKVVKFSFDTKETFTNEI
jgi:prolipoprotein diacylglyceryltransferase